MRLPGQLGNLKRRLFPRDGVDSQLRQSKSPGDGSDPSRRSSDARHQVPPLLEEIASAIVEPVLAQHHHYLPFQKRMAFLIWAGS